MFRHFDADRSGSIDQAELSRALANFGYNLNPRLLSTVVNKFGEWQGRNGLGRAAVVHGRAAPPITCFALTPLPVFCNFAHSLKCVLLPTTLPNQPTTAGASRLTGEATL